MSGARKGIRDNELSRRPELRNGNDTPYETLMTITMMTAHLLLSPISKPHIRLELLDFGRPQKVVPVDLFPKSPHQDRDTGMYWGIYNFTGPKLSGRSAPNASVFAFR